MLTRSAVVGGSPNPSNRETTDSGGRAITGDEAVSQQPEQDAVSRMDDFEVIRERQNVMTALAELTDRYRRLNAEMTRRETLRWMVAR
jgi:hypothetical protein